MPTVTGEIHIDSPKEKVWAVLADLATVRHFNPGVTNAYYISDTKEGVGASRRCDLVDGGYVLERASEWKPGEAYTLEIYEGTTPFQNADGAFTVKDDRQGTIVSLTLGFELRVDAPVDPQEVEQQYRELIPAVLAGLKHYVETGQPLPVPARG